MVETMDRLLDQAQRMATSRYTRSSQRAKWTRLAGQLLWYKDQILRAMTYEALEQDVNQAIRDMADDRRKQSLARYPVIQRAPFQPTVVKKVHQDEEVKDSTYTDDDSKQPVA